MRAQQSSSKKMKLGWESVQLSRFWSAPVEAPSLLAAGTKSEVAGDSIFFIFIFLLSQDILSGST